MTNPCVKYYPNYFKPELAEKMYNKLLEEIPFKQGYVTMRGKTYPERRLTSFHTITGKNYKYSGKVMKSEPMTPLLNNILKLLHKKVSSGLNSVLCNYYKSENSKIGWHSDDERYIEPIIVSLSFGGTRTFLMQSRTNKDEKYSYKLNSGDMIIMHGKCQSLYKHCIKPLTKAEIAQGFKPRVNLTFRTMKN